jgi:calcineurin-like phosphoesterase family protein
MIDSLYYPFRKWSENAAVWLYSDPHFGDFESYTFRGLITDKTKEELDKFQVDRINKFVNKNDTIIFLGDIGDPTLLKKIKGHKVLIAGNHDRGAAFYKDYFDEIYTGCLTISDRIILSHEPIEGCPPFLFNIHGHDHSGTDFKDYVLRDYDCDIPSEQMVTNVLATIKQYKLNRFNVCAEWINYKPVALKDIINSGVLSNIPTIHRDYLDKK